MTVFWRLSRNICPTPFKGMERRSLRDAIFREVTSNILIHREYSSGVPARLIIERGKVTTYNASRPHGFGPIDPAHFVPYPKNPVLGAFFREIDRADELGSGMRKMMLYGKKYGGADPQLIEGDVFRMVISVPEFEQDGTRMGPGRDPDGIQKGPGRRHVRSMPESERSTDSRTISERYTASYFAFLSSGTGHQCIA